MKKTNTQIAIWLSKKEAAELRKRAEDEQRSLSNYLRLIVIGKAGAV